ncbi:MAG TPA: polysaccharide deacetylase family protein [Candidatus Acidoferrales bacterium]|nr:polysaccharide deacetylase family protein [Candidatus Acidoferrales bacterium]
MTKLVKIATFLYHDVSDDPTESGFQRQSALAYKQTREVFSSHLDRIASAGFTPGLVTDVNFRRPGKHVLITFDDGGKGALHAAEELNRRGWKGHFFITTSLLGSRTFLDVSATRYLHNCGHVIGSHSHTHPDIFRAQSFEQMVEEWRVSCDLLSNVLGAEILTGSVPGGDVSRRVFRSADAAGMKFLFTSDAYLNPRKQGDCWILGRVCPKAEAPLPYVQKLAEFRGWRKELARGRMKTALKTAFSPLYRIYVRHALQ